MATKDHDMEMTIANHRNKSPSLYKFNKDKGDSKESSSPPKRHQKKKL